MTSIPAIRSEEIRFGLVLYGGVSLAIYMNGIAHEFFRSVRGSGVYGLIRRLTDSDMVVDVISGTSACGIATRLAGERGPSDADLLAGLERLTKEQLLGFASAYAATTPKPGVDKALDKAQNASERTAVAKAILKAAKDQQRTDRLESELRHSNPPLFP